MKKILVILVFQLGILAINGQKSAEYKFVINGIIGMSNVVPIQDAVIEIDDQVKFTNESGEFSIKLESEEIQIKIHHLGFSKIDTILKKNELNSRTELIIIADCWVNKELAISDIANNEIKLLLVGGIASVFVLGQESAEESFNFRYDDFGCVAPPDECIKEYNFMMFKYLDNMYGKSWRKIVRKDVIGLNENNRGSKIK